MDNKEVESVARLDVCDTNIQTSPSRSEISSGTGDEGQTCASSSKPPHMDIKGSEGPLSGVGHNNQEKPKDVDTRDKLRPEITEEHKILIEKVKQHAAKIQVVYRSFMEREKTVDVNNCDGESRGQSEKGAGVYSDGGVNAFNALQLHNLSVLSRIYIGSIHFELNEESIRKAFSEFGPIKSISLSNDPITGHHKGFCFIEFETPEAAALALETMNGAELGGRIVKVGRPNNFPCDLPPGISRPILRRIYVSNVHKYVTESELTEVFRAFGNIVKCVLLPDASTGCHKGYGYVEYDNEEAAQSSIIALKGFSLGGLYIKVGRTIVGGDLPPGMSVLDKLSSNIKIGKTFVTKVEAGRQLPFNKQTIGSKMLLTNMITLGELDKDAERDIVEECTKYGCVLEVDIVNSGEDKDQFAKVCVAFKGSDDSKNAVNMLNGRWFGGRQVSATETPL